MSKIKCPYCGAENSGEFPFCKECGRVLPMGDEYEVMAESVGAVFEWRWVIIAATVTIVLTSLVVLAYSWFGWDLSFMKAPRSMRIDEPQVTSVTPEWVLTPAPNEMLLTINTRGKSDYTPEHAVAAIICGKTVKVLPHGNARIRPDKFSLLGVDFIRYRIPQDGDVLVEEVPACKKEGFHDVAVKFENGRKLYKYDAVYISPVNKPWYAFYMDLSALKGYFNDDNLKPIELAMASTEEMKPVLDELVKTLRNLAKEKEQMKLLSLAFWGLFLFELLSFFLGGFVAARLSPGISIKEALAAGMIAAVIMIFRNIYFFHAGGSYMIFQLLIMFPLYTAVSSFGGYMGEKFQGTVQ